MNKPFDLEAAKRGEPIEVWFTLDRDKSIPSWFGTWVPAKFLCSSTQGHILIERSDGNVIQAVETKGIEHNLRMAPKKEIRRYRRFEHVQDNGKILIDVLNKGYDLFPTPSDLEKSKYFHKWIDFEWQSVEVEV